MRADLHMHSIYSDGVFNIKELDDYAFTKGLDIIAITDHDTVKSHKDIKSMVYKTKILTGVEISSEMLGSTVHILGYFYNNDDPSETLYNYLEERSLERKKRVYETISRLKEFFDIEITYDEIATYADGIIGRPHIAKAIEKKYSIPFDEVFDKFIGNGKEAYIPSTKIATPEAIQLLKNNNAFVVLAHPGLIKNLNVEEIVKLGVDGIEIRYPKHSESEIQKYSELAKKYDLVITGGSDFHGPRVSADMGETYIEDKELELFLKRIYKK